MINVDYTTIKATFKDTIWLFTKNFRKICYTFGLKNKFHLDLSEYLIRNKPK